MSLWYASGPPSRQTNLCQSHADASSVATRVAEARFHSGESATPRSFSAKSAADSAAARSMASDGTSL